MAINPILKYPSNIAAVSEAYPYGAARNIITANDGTGTPLEAGWVNDLLGFIQSALADGGAVPNGTPESVSNPQVLMALKKVKELSSVAAARANAGAYTGETRILYGGGIMHWVAASVDLDDGYNVLGAFAPSGRWVRNYGALPAKHFDGLDVSGSIGVITVGAGAALDSTGSRMLRMAAPFTKVVQNGAAYVPGAGERGLPAGVTVAAGSQLHVFLLLLPNGTFDIGFDTALDAEHLREGDLACAATHYRRISSCVVSAVDGGGVASLRAFSHDTSGVYRFVTPIIYEGTCDGTTGIAEWARTAVALPLGIEVEAVYGVAPTVENAPTVVYPVASTTPVLQHIVAGIYHAFGGLSSVTPQLRYKYSGKAEDGGFASYTLTATGPKAVKWILEGFIDDRKQY